MCRLKSVGSESRERVLRIRCRCRVLTAVGIESRDDGRIRLVARVGMTKRDFLVMFGNDQGEIHQCDDDAAVMADILDSGDAVSLFVSINSKKFIIEKSIANSLFKNSSSRVSVNRAIQGSKRRRNFWLSEKLLKMPGRRRYWQIWYAHIIL